MKYVQCQKTGNAREYKIVLGAIKPKGLNRIAKIAYMRKENQYLVITTLDMSVHCVKYIVVFC